MASRFPSTHPIIRQGGEQYLAQARALKTGLAQTSQVIGNFFRMVLPFLIVRHLPYIRVN